MSTESQPRADARTRLSDERSRVVDAAEAARRRATASMVLMTLLFVVGGIVIVLSVRAEQTVSRLNSLAESRSSLIDHIAYRTNLVLDSEFRRSVPPEFADALILEFDHYQAEDLRLRSEIADALVDARSAPTRYLSFVDSAALNEVESNMVDSALLETAFNAPARLASRNDQLTEDELNLLSALTSHEFSAPAERAEALAQDLVDDSRGATTTFTIAVGLSTLAILAALWLLALGPANRASRVLVVALDHHASEIEHSYARASAAQRIAGLGYWYKSGDSDAIECSPELAEMLTGGVGPPPKTLQELADLTQGPGDDVGYSTYQRLSHEPGVAEMTHLVSTPGRAELTLRERVESFSGPESIGLTGVMLDISDIVAAQQVLLRMEKFEIVELLISGVAHDFNNLLGIITGNAELALDAAEPGVDGHLHSIIDASIAAAALIGQLRQTALDPLAVAEQFVVADALARVTATLSTPPGIAVDLRIDDDAAATTVLVNRGVFESSIVNLIINAFDAIGEGGGRVEVRLSLDHAGSGIVDGRVTSSTPRLRGRPLARIAVVDDGCGMTDQVRRRALQPFFTTKSHGAGKSQRAGHHMGLGLWSVFSFAKAWEGDIEINSVPGAGTQIEMTLAAVEAAPNTQEPAPPLEPFASGAELLLVEDSEELLEIGEQTLRNWGFDVTAVAEYDAAARILRQSNDIRVLVSDVRLGPHASGFDLALQAINSDPPIGVVLQSGALGAEDMPDGLSESGCIFLAKPYTRAELHSAIDEVLRLADRSGRP